MREKNEAKKVYRNSQKESKWYMAKKQPLKDYFNTQIYLYMKKKNKKKED